MGLLLGSRFNPVHVELIPLLDVDVWGAVTPMLVEFWGVIALLSLGFTPWPDTLYVLSLIHI